MALREDIGEFPVAEGVGICGNSGNARDAKSPAPEEMRSKESLKEFRILPSPEPIEPCREPDARRVIPPKSGIAVLRTFFRTQPRTPVMTDFLSRLLLEPWEEAVEPVLDRKLLTVLLECGMCQYLN